MKARKKPVVIDFKKWDGDGFAMLEWSSLVADTKKTYLYLTGKNSDQLCVHSLEHKDGGVLRLRRL